MTSSIIPQKASFSLRKKIFWLDNLAKKGLINRLTNISRGYLRIIDEGEVMRFGNANTESDCKATIKISDRRFYSAIAFGGSVAAGESYFSGHWECDNLTALVRILLINREVLDNMDESFSRIQAPIMQILHWLSRNTREGSKKNISVHYDLGNDLFKLFLDKNMMYSSAIYPSADSTLEEASTYKLERICQKLQLSEKDHLLEIGTGWGGFAIYAAQNYGCKITTTTISEEQFILAKKRIEDAGFSSKITVLLSDYRDLKGRYDKLVSIEMIEAIGHQYINTYFKKCSELLKPKGVMLIQAITIADQRYKSALKEVDFIKRYIFPGCFIPSVNAMQDAITKSSDMRIFNLEDIGPHYAKTLHDWRRRFFNNIESVKALGYPEEFVRLWDFYLCYCEGGFIERVISDVQLTLVKPNNRLEYSD